MVGVVERGMMLGGLVVPDSDGCAPTAGSPRAVAIEGVGSPDIPDGGQCPGG